MKEQSIGELKSRVHLGSTLIKMLHKDSDPRAAAAIERLQGQQRQLNEVLVAKVKAEREARGEPQPPPVVVGCKAVVLSGKAQGSPALQSGPVGSVQVVAEGDGSTTLVLQL